MIPVHDAASAVVVEPVRPRVRPAARTRASAPAAVVDVPRAGDPRSRRTVTRGDAAPVVTAALVVIVSGDVVGSLLAGATVLGAVALHRLATVGRFGFGDGFLAFRPDAEWPPGVQEDDEIHWSWSDDRSRADADPAPTS